MSLVSRDVAIAVPWHEALNAGRADRLAARTDDDVDVAGPRGGGSGVALAKNWASRAGICLEPSRWFHRDGTVVVEERTRWHAEDTGGWSEPQPVATAFLVQRGRARRGARFNTLPAALAGAGLNASATVDGAQSSIFIVRAFILNALAKVAFGWASLVASIQKARIDSGLNGSLHHPRESYPSQDTRIHA